MEYDLKIITIGKIIQKIKDKELYLKPKIYANDYDFKELDLNNESDADLVQRNYIWKKSQKQNLIRTIFTNFFVPAIVVYEKEDDENYKYSLIDGKQRTNTIWMYHEDKFKYIYNDGVTRKNRKFSELTEIEKDRFENYEVPIIVLKDLDIEQLRTIFETLNVNSTKLKPQEVRHAIYNNVLTKEINKIHSFSNENNNESDKDDIIELFLKTSLFNEKKLFDRTLDEFIVKLIRLFLKREILNDGKKQIDLYYEELPTNSNFKNLFSESGNKSSEQFFSSLVEVLKFYNDLESLIPKEIKKPIIIYILFYFSINIDESNFSIIDWKNLNEEKWEKVFRELNTNADFNKAMRNQNDKSRRKTLIKEFKTTYFKIFNI